MLRISSSRSALSPQHHEREAGQGRGGPWPPHDLAWGSCWRAARPKSKGRYRRSIPTASFDCAQDASFNFTRRFAPSTLSERPAKVGEGPGHQAISHGDHVGMQRGRSRRGGGVEVPGRRGWRGLPTASFDFTRPCGPRSRSGCCGEVKSKEGTGRRRGVAWVQVRRFRAGKKNSPPGSDPVGGLSLC